LLKVWSDEEQDTHSLRFDGFAFILVLAAFQPPGGAPFDREDFLPSLGVFGSLLSRCRLRSRHLFLFLEIAVNSIGKGREG